MRAVLSFVTGSILLAGALARAAEPPAPAPIHKIHVEQGFIDDAQLLAVARPLRNSGYGRYLEGLLQHAQG